LGRRGRRPLQKLILYPPLYVFVFHSLVRMENKKAPPTRDDAFSHIERELIEDETNNTIQNLNYSQPPEMFMTWLVTYLDSSEARYRAM